MANRDHYCAPNEIDQVPRGTLTLTVHANQDWEPVYVDYSVIPQSVRHLVLDYPGFTFAKTQLPSSLSSLELVGSESGESVALELEGLERLSLIYCKFPEITQLPSSLESLNLDACDRLRKVCKLPPTMDGVQITFCNRIVHLDFLPSDYLGALSVADLRQLKSLEGIPPRVGNLYLADLMLRTLKHIENVPELLHISSCSIEDGLSSIKSTAKIGHLALRVMSLTGDPLSPETEVGKVSLQSTEVELSVFPDNLKDMSIVSCDYETLEGMPQDLERLSLIELEMLDSYYGLPCCLSHLEIAGIYGPTDFPRLCWLKTANIDYVITIDGVEYQNGDDYMADTKCLKKGATL